MAMTDLERPSMAAADHESPNFVTAARYVEEKARNLMPDWLRSEVEVEYLVILTRDMSKLLEYSAQARWHAGRLRSPDDKPVFNVGPHQIPGVTAPLVGIAIDNTTDLKGGAFFKSGSAKVVPALLDSGFVHREVQGSNGSSLSVVEKQDTASRVAACIADVAIPVPERASLSTQRP